MERLRAACPQSAWSGAPGRCQWCDAPIPPNSRRRTWCSDAHRRAFEREHLWSRARAWARRRAKYRCSRPGCDAPRELLEVNHIDPVLGAGYGPSCKHHSANLEVLCRPHHQEVTNRQRRDRAAG